MEIKRNEATTNRPIDRVVDAPYVLIDIPFYLGELKKEKEWEKFDRNGITVFKSNDVAMVLTILKKGADMIENTVDGYLTMQIIEGKIRLTTENGNTDVSQHQIVAIHPGIYNSIEALENSVILLTNRITDIEEEDENDIEDDDEE
jgi:quercetin dioxygenase-like cupin family protein